MNAFDVLGLYRTREQALEAARDAIGLKTATSRIKGANQLASWLSLVPDSKVFTDLTNTSNSDAALSTKSASQGIHVLTAGVEYSTIVWCDRSKNVDESWGFLDPIRGRLPNANELNDGNYGVGSSWNDLMAALKALPGNPLPFDHLHTHNISTGMMIGSLEILSIPGWSIPHGTGLHNWIQYWSAGLTPKNMFTPDRFSASSIDLQIKNQYAGAGVNFYIVLEEEIGTPLTTQIGAFELIPY